MSDPFDILHSELVRVAAHPDSGHARARRSRGTLMRAQSHGWLRRPLVLTIMLLGASASAGGLALAGTFNGGTINPQAWQDGQRVQPEPSTTQDQTAIEILRRPRVASDALYPYDSQVLTDTPAGGAEGVNVSLSRRVQGLTSGAAWVIPANNGVICLVADNAQALAQDKELGPLPSTHVPGAAGITYCAPASEVNTGWDLTYANTSNIPGSDYTAGIVPDGVSQVTVTVADGETASLPVHENVWMGAVPGTPVSVTFNGPDGPVTSSGS
jgi:hypothetical protein